MIRFWRIWLDLRELSFSWRLEAGGNIWVTWSLTCMCCGRFSLGCGKGCWLCGVCEGCLEKMEPQEEGEDW